MFLPQNIFSRVNHVGISITPYAVRGVVVESSNKITARAEIIAENLLIDGEKVNITALVTSLKQLKQQLTLDIVYAACCFPEKLAYTREHVLPAINDDEINEAIHWQLGNIFPLNPADLYADWKLIQKTDKEVRIVISAVNKKLIDSLIASCNAAGIKPLAFESSASALARSFEKIPEKAIIVEIDNLGSSITLVEQGISSITATTNFSSVSSGQNALEEIAATINQLKEKSNNPKTAIYATGEKADPEIITALGNLIGQPVNLLGSDQIPSSFQGAYVESISTIEAPKSNQTINLLPKTIEQLYQSDTDIAQAKTVAKYGIAMSGFAFLLSSGIFILALILKQTSLNQLLSIPEAPPPPQGVNLNIFLQKSQKLNQLKSVEYFPKAHFGTILSTLDMAILRQISYDASKKIIKVTLSSLNRSDLVNLKTKLDETKLFGPISIPLSALNSDSSENIVLNLLINNQTP